MELIETKISVFRNKAQSILEYTVFIVMVALAFLSIYARTNIQTLLQGSWKRNIAAISEEQHSSASTTTYSADMQVDSMQILQGDAYFDNW
ncbi:MAG: hypothetical protein ABIA97_04170 [Candidatus Omnitrophota bacterium]